jgi:hypothetical protein
LNKVDSAATRMVTNTIALEAEGNFGGLILNYDHAGLSFGVILWAQKSGRLLEILTAFRDADPQLFVHIFGEGDSAVADGLLQYLAGPNGGVDPATGGATNPNYDLTGDVWVRRFRSAALEPRYQAVQFDVSLQNFMSSLSRLSQYSQCVQSERAVAFMLDLANQFGDGGARRIYQSVVQSDMSEWDCLEQIADKSVDRMQDVFQAVTRARRNRFLFTQFLQNTPFKPREVQQSSERDT